MALVYGVKASVQSAAHNKAHLCHPSLEPVEVRFHHGTQDIVFWLKCSDSLVDLCRRKQFRLDLRNGNLVRQDGTPVSSEAALAFQKKFKRSPPPWIAQRFGKFGFPGASAVLDLNPAGLPRLQSENSLREDDDSTRPKLDAPFAKQVRHEVTSLPRARVVRVEAPPNKSRPPSIEALSSIAARFRNDPHFPSEHIRSGCEARADAVAVELKEKGIASMRIFASGNLQASNRLMRVKWRCHVANLIQAKDGSSARLFVVDPSLSGTAMRLVDWLKRICPSSGELLVDVTSQEQFGAPLWWTERKALEERHELTAHELERQREWLKPVRVVGGRLESLEHRGQDALLKFEGTDEVWHWDAVQMNGTLGASLVGGVGEFAVNTQTREIVSLPRARRTMTSD